MTQPAQPDSVRDTVISVRGEAQLEVEPDAADVRVTVETRAAQQAEAMRAAATASSAVQNRLAELGGVSRRALISREPLTWSAGSVSSHADHHHDPLSGEKTVVGHIAVVHVHVGVRNFSLLPAVLAALIADDVLRVHNVGWSVDEDNPRWRDVRASAIDAAVAKGRDYATALGGRLVRLEQLADVGLLANTGADRGESLMRARVTLASGLSRGGYLEGAVPSVDPEPQLLSASVDARFAAEVEFAG